MRTLDYITILRCPACNGCLNEGELKLYDTFDGYCEECFSISMKAAYTEDFTKRIKDE